MTERQSSTNRTFTNNNNNIDSTANNNKQAQVQAPQHQHFMNVPQIPQINTNTNILQQLGLPPIQPQPPAAFQPVQPVAFPVLPQIQPVLPALNASAPAFTPNPCANIPLLNTPNTAQAQAPANNILAQNQIAAIKQKVNESMAKLQILSLQLNTLNLMNQQNQTIQSLQQYQNVYQQYQLELTNTYLLNQYLQNLTNIVSTPTPQGPVPAPVNANTPAPVTPQLLNGKSSALETIEEGEEEEMENNDNIAAIAGAQIASISPMTENEGTEAQAAAFANAVAQMDEMKNDTLEQESLSSSQIGEHESASTMSIDDHFTNW
eukprot:CAMPEP_0201570666 /NCGR_PEP_ID=MMETSP0190_2-20130828/13016_1 /ASSEMBLY_ACC=CAM_ASM_000263 /TAXON_ID=37353 /ORGANISM="Rosalina sp." /LENGTH=319 /DNA_ID=CAMNT_0047994437 /DNA_START=200 /DNA_END=1155 /DNA_ORIENTATION=+